ncbi:MAG: SufE family protein [Melioribacteraceae bacterium]|nr:SufE family protein [Melioribacteraceae bacterium]
MTLKEKQDELVKEFENFTEWDDKYAFLIKLGRELPELPDVFKTEKYKINGCQSQVWMNAKQTDGKVFLEADSDAAIVKGLIAVLIKVYSGSTPEEILSNPPDFLSKIGIDNHLSPTRKNGLGAMLKQIQMYAFALKAMKK